jgi:hypothetical protein
MENGGTDTNAHRDRDQRIRVADIGWHVQQRQTDEESRCKKYKRRQHDRFVFVLCPLSRSLHYPDRHA